MKIFKILFGLLVIGVIVASFTINDVLPVAEPTDLTERFAGEEYNEAKFTFTKMLDNLSDPESWNAKIEVKNTELWKEYLHTQMSELFKDILADGQTELRFNTDANIYYLSDIEMSIEESDNAFLNRLPPDCTYLCANCPPGSNCMTFWHCQPCCGCNCLYLCRTP